MAEMEFDEIQRALSVPETPQGITRRQVLQGAMFAAGTLAASRYFEMASWATGSSKPDDGILVVIQLGGGNDGLNTVIPTSDSAYHQKRGPLAVSPSAALDLGAGHGLHPNLRALKARYDAGKVAVVQGVGVPDASLSHFASVDTWMRGAASPTTRTGWLGRYLDGHRGGDLAGVAIGTMCPRA